MDSGDLRGRDVGKRINPNLYCKLDIEVYPIVRAANKDPGKASVVGTGIAGIWAYPKD
jgi:hypothetical protein